MTTDSEDRPPHFRNPPPQPGPRQQRRAWWLVGGVVLVVGIVAALIIGNRATSSSEAEPTTDDPDIRYSGTVVLPAAAGTIDLDSTPPQVGSDVRRTDIRVHATTRYSSVEIGNEDLAMTSMVDADPDPSPDDCVARIEEKGMHHATVTVDSRFCMQTTDGHLAFFRVSTAPNDGKGPVHLAVTVWEL